MNYAQTQSTLMMAKLTLLKHPFGIQPGKHFILCRHRELTESRVMNSTQQLCLCANAFLSQ